MRRLLFGAVVVAAFAINAAPSQAACIANFNWHGYAYFGYTQVSSADIGAPIPVPARVPSCNDVVMNGVIEPVTYSDQAVSELQGIEPSIALTDGSLFYINQSTFPALKSHPLNRLVRDWKEQQVGGKRCRLEGRAVIDAFGMHVKGAQIIVVAGTKVEPQRHGTGFIPPGMRVRVEGSECAKLRGSTTLTVKASRISRA